MTIVAHRTPSPVDEPGDDIADTPPDLPDGEPPFEIEPEPGELPEHDPLPPEEPARDVEPARVARQRRLIDAFAAALQRGVDRPVRMVETHISWVLLAGERAYKFKKALRLSFLDFSTLAKRRRCCEEELRLNRRLAPELYLAVTAITGTPQEPVAGGKGRALEYAVTMHAFDQEALWSERLGRGMVVAPDIDQLAQRLARFHGEAAQAAPDSAWGSPRMLTETASETLSALAALAMDHAAAADVARLHAWLAEAAERLQPAFLHRKAAGNVRECHGDLHCGNVITVDGRSTAFDCIEFNPRMRWIDVMDDLAFLCMDLACRGRSDFAARLLNVWLEGTGDYEGLSVFCYYRVLRALVRCKVAWMRAAQLAGHGDCARWLGEGRAYLEFASRCRRAGEAAILITHGVSGSGKSTLTALLLQELGAVRVRSDVERKRLHALASHALYSDAATRDTYARLESVAAQAVKAGWPVIVDAAFLEPEQRRPFRLLAARLGVAFAILDVHASPGILRNRIEGRAAQRDDPSDANIEVLRAQLARMQPLRDEEKPEVVAADTSAGINPTMARQIAAMLLERMRRGATTSSQGD